MENLPDAEVKGEIVPAEEQAPRRILSDEELRIEKLRRIEDELLAENLGIVRDAARFRELDPAKPEIPADWRDELGEKAAIERYRMATAAWLPAKDAPVGLKMAQSVALGIIKARSVEKAAPRTLNIAFVQLPAPQVDFEEVEIDGNK